MDNDEFFGKSPYITAQTVLSGKWSMYLLYLLQYGSLRFNELLRLMPEEMTHTTLSRQLKILEENGLIIRTDYAQIPPKVEYSLSDIGKKFDKVISALGAWGKEYITYMESQQEQD